MSQFVRPVTAGDLEQVRAIYNHAVIHTDATLDTEEKSPAQMLDWLAAHQGRNAALLVERDSRVLGYGTLSPFATRGGYFASTEISIYVAPGDQGRGVGTSLCAALTGLARDEGYSTVMCFITDTNIASIRMVTAAGYKSSGILCHIGFKLGRLVNLEVYQHVFAENLARYDQDHDLPATERST
ncbi:phosphinothricin acetyltransferase [Micromonospora matsumotoense]|uniref:Phosphinothricin acetyltransferase n=1 Tax=Micromonospora matsumotoense TaxID=121616 RepID=A0A1C4YUK5_9ACTN|nr:GNAT family N-acetyltransferase [Micromonospora matsumotoense]SCF24413.1 phosphinothricin acetyltransferase [Micromonospora matsumotoense]